MVFSVSFLGQDFHQIEHHRSEVLIYFIALSAALWFGNKGHYFYELCAICRMSNGWQDVQNCQINNFNYAFFSLFWFWLIDFSSQTLCSCLSDLWNFDGQSNFFGEESSKSRKVGIFVRKHNWGISLSTVLSRIGGRRSDVLDSNNKLWLNSVSAPAKPANEIFQLKDLSQP